MKVPDDQIPEEMNYADYCDALKDERHVCFTPRAKRAQNPQVPVGGKLQENTPLDESWRTAS